MTTIANAKNRAPRNEFPRTSDKAPCSMRVIEKRRTVILTRSYVKKVNWRLGFFAGVVSSLPEASVGWLTNLDIQHSSAEIVPGFLTLSAVKTCNHLSPVYAESSQSDWFKGGCAS